MIKALRKSAVGLLSLLAVSGCSTNHEPQTPERIYRIDFDGEFVQTYRSNWPLAFDSCDFESNDMVIGGRFILPDDEEYQTLGELEARLNGPEERLTSITLYSNEEGPTSTGKLTYVSSDDGVVYWRLLSVDTERCVSFVLDIDLSLFVENDQTPGIMVLRGCFYAYHDFGGTPIC